MEHDRAIVIQGSKGPQIVQNRVVLKCVIVLGSMENMMSSLARMISPQCRGDLKLRTNLPIDVFSVPRGMDKGRG